jgi:hypothetical protein
LRSLLLLLLVLVLKLLLLESLRALDTIGPWLGSSLSGVPGNTATIIAVVYFVIVLAPCSNGSP